MTAFIRMRFIRALLWLFFAGFGYLITSSLVTGTVKACDKRGGNCRTYYWHESPIDFIWELLPMALPAALAGTALYWSYFRK